MKKRFFLSLVCSLLATALVSLDVISFCLAGSVRQILWLSIGNAALILAVSLYFIARNDTDEQKRPISKTEIVLRIVRLYFGLAILGIVAWLIGECAILIIGTDTPYFELKVLLGVAIVAALFVIFGAIVIFRRLRRAQIIDFFINVVLWSIILALCGGLVYVIFAYVKPLLV